MKYRKIGATTVSAIGLGAMPLSIAGHPDEAQAIRTIHAALEAGVTLIDTADAYRPGINDPSGNGHNERIIAAALKAYSGDKSAVVVATKVGNIKPDPASTNDDWIVDASPAYITRSCEGSLRALELDCIPLYQLHRPDPVIPLEESLGAMMQLQDAGKIHMIGVSNMGLDLLDRARHALGSRGLASVQNQFSPAVIKRPEVIDYCNRHDIAFLPWSPLGGVGNADQLATTKAFVQIGARHGVSPQQIALAWHLAKGPRVIPIPGARRPETILDSARAAELLLTAEELAELDGVTADARH